MIYCTMNNIPENNKNAAKPDLHSSTVFNLFGYRPMDTIDLLTCIAMFAFMAVALGLTHCLGAVYCVQYSAEG